MEAFTSISESQGSSEAAYWLLQLLCQCRSAQDYQSQREGHLGRRSQLLSQVCYLDTGPFQILDSWQYFRYTSIRVGMPERLDADVANRSYTPHECRLRDLTYAANIYVDVEYTRGKQIVKRKNVNIGRLPVMLRSSNCVLTGRSEAELARMKECPLDPGMWHECSSYWEHYL